MISSLRATLFPCMLVLFAAVGCGHQRIFPTAASTPETVHSSDLADEVSDPVRAVAAQDGFFPLDLGNRWDYVYTYTTQFRLGDGSTPQPPIVGMTTTELRLVCCQDVGGRSYVAQRGTYKSGGRTLWTLFRQDRAGLYELWSSVGKPLCDSAPAFTASDNSSEFRAVDAGEWQRKIDGIHGSRARDAIRLASPILESRVERLAASVGFGGAMSARRGPPGAPMDNEATRLRYPLHPGASWDVRPPRLLPLFATVEGVDAVRLPTGRAAAYRIRYTDAVPGSDAVVRVWYGRSGYLGMVGHSSYTIPGLDGAPPDTVVADWSDVLVGICLVAPPGRHRE